MAKQEDVFQGSFLTQNTNMVLFFPSSEIDDGLSAVYDYGQNGAELKITSSNIGGKQWCN